MPMDGAADAWSERELSGCTLADDRLVTRLRKLLVQMGSAMEQSIPLVCQDWANTKAAYRFFSNERAVRSEEHTSELQSLMRISYAVFGLKKKNNIPKRQ